MSRFTTRAGFTLIEILVVITIIGILSAILYANFGDAREDAKNKAMQTEMRETQLALELYKAQNGLYPNALTGLIPEFIASTPSVSKSGNGSCVITYATGVDDSWYKLTAARCHAGATTAAEGVQSDDDFARCPTTCGGNCTTNNYAQTVVEFYESYAIYSTGGECQ